MNRAPNGEPGRPLSAFIYDYRRNKYLTPSTSLLDHAGYFHSSMFAHSLACSPSRWDQNSQEHPSTQRPITYVILTSYFLHSKSRWSKSVSSYTGVAESFFPDIIFTLNWLDKLDKQQATTIQDKDEKNIKISICTLLTSLALLSESLTSHVVLGKRNIDWSVCVRANKSIVEVLQMALEIWFVNLSSKQVRLLVVFSVKLLSCWASS